MAVIGKFTGRTFLYKIVSKECRAPFWMRLPSSDIMVYEQIFIDKDYEISLNKSPKTIIDAGANIGFSAIYFANKYPDATIITIEPERYNYELLKKNTASYANIKLINKALWHKQDTITLIDPGIGHWGYRTAKTSESSVAQHNGRHQVETITLEQLVEDFQLSTIDILKIDIEGAECEVFSEVSTWLDKVEVMIIELHEHMRIGCNRSFYCHTPGFANEWWQGENVILARTRAVKHHK